VLVWIAGRQQANDLRSNITKDLDLMERLAQSPAGEPHAKKVAENALESIDVLVARDRRRRSVGTVVRWLWPGYLLLAMQIAVGPFHDDELTGITAWLVKDDGLVYVTWAYFVVASMAMIYVEWRRANPKAPSQNAGQGNGSNSGSASTQPPSNTP
jgi:hypothetical protein